MAAVEDKQPIFPCRICGRRFIKSSLEKHEPACKKLTKMQRKVFDSGKQRASNSDIPLKDVLKAKKEREKMGGFFPRPQTHWRERHEEFVGAVSASKQVGVALKTGAPLPPPPKTAGNAGYVQCDFCGRSFNKNAADRHIEFCKEQNARKMITNKMASSRQGIQPPPPQTGSVKSQHKIETAIAKTTTTTTHHSTSSATRNGISAPKTPSTASSRSTASRPGSAKGPRRPSNGHAQQIVPAQGIAQIGGAAVDGKGGGASKLPQPTATKRSNSAPRNTNNTAETAHGQVEINGRAGTGSKSSFATPKSAGTGTLMTKVGGGAGANTTMASRTMMIKSNSKQKIG